MAASLCQMESSRQRSVDNWKEFFRPVVFDLGINTHGGPAVLMSGQILRYALFNATKFVCIWEPSFAAYLTKKRAEGKHYNVAISHAAKKLVRLIYALQTSGRAFRPAA